MPHEGSVQSPPDHSQVVVFPPLIPACGFIVALVLDTLWPSGGLIPVSMRTAVRSLGGAVVCMGVAGFAWMVATMKKAETPIHNSATPIALVETGPFRLTRNPMYLFGAVALSGLSLLWLHLWLLAMVPLVLLATHYGVVLREEAYLERKFGEPYRQYRARVRRWV
jgi:protein-S-isoprenylcysteine O-methyltransferase Ste14